MGTDRVLVIGGTGLVGQHLVRRLVAQGKLVTVTSRSTRDLPAGVVSISLDLSVAGWTESSKLGRDDFDLVAHLAYSSSGDDAYNRGVTTSSVSEALEFFRNSNSVRHFIYLGSVVIFGMESSIEFSDETMPKVADTSYSTNKVDATLAVMGSDPHFNVSVLHPTGIYTRASQRIETYRDLLSWGYLALNRGGAGLNNIVHAEDVAAAIEACFYRTGGGRAEEYVLNGETISYSDWFTILEASVKRKTLRHLPVWFAPVCRGPIRRLLANFFLLPIVMPAYKREMYEQKRVFVSEKAKLHFGWAPRAVFLDIFSTSLLGSGS